MVNKLLEVLGKCGIEEYRITDTTLESRELFFVKKQLDTRRIENIHNAQVVVFRRFEKDGQQFMGNADFFAEPSMTESELIERTKAAYMAAGFVPNRPYEFSAPEKSGLVKMPSTIGEVSMQEAANRLTEALFRNDTANDVFINSAEIFVYKKTVRIVSGTGTDVSYEKFSTSGEFVTQCKEPSDVETYMDFAYDDLCLDQLAEKVLTTLAMTKDRAVAKPNTFTGEADIVLSDSYAAEVLSFYPEKAHASAIYMQMSDFEVGKSAQGDLSEITGDLLSMDYLPTTPYSEEGVKLIERKAVENGIFKTIFAGERYSSYLGVPVTGDYHKFGFNTGSMTFDEMKKTKGFHVVNFSDFQMDAVTGHFRGEIRLAYYNDGKTIIPITGGSVNGSIFEAQKSIKLSAEKQETTKLVGPKAILLKNVAIAGCEN